MQVRSHHYLYKNQMLNNDHFALNVKIQLFNHPSVKSSQRCVQCVRTSLLSLSALFISHHRSNLSPPRPRPSPHWHCTGGTGPGKEKTGCQDPPALRHDDYSAACSEYEFRLTWDMVKIVHDKQICLGSRGRQEGCGRYFLIHLLIH